MTSCQSKDTPIVVVFVDREVHRLPFEEGSSLEKAGRIVLVGGRVPLKSTQSIPAPSPM